MLLLSDYSSTQQEVLVAAYQLYEQDADAEEFVDTCKRVLKQLSALDQAHLEAFAGVVCADGRFSDYQQALLVTMWNGIEPRVMAAWDVFVYDRRESELVDTLSRSCKLLASVELVWPELETVGWRCKLLVGIGSIWPKVDTLSA